MDNQSCVARTPKFVWPLVLGILLWIVVVVTASQLRMSATFDEQNHVTRGIAILRTGDFRLCIHHPPFANILEGLPVAWVDNGFSTKLPAWDPKNSKNQIWSVSYKTIWSIPERGIRLIQLARIPVLLFTLTLALVIFLWSRELFGPWGGLLSLTLFALDPNILAHSGLATTDIPAACTIVLAVYLLRRYLWKPSRSAFLLAGLGIGIALATKFSALILLPILALTLLGFALYPSQLVESLSARWASFSMGKRVARAVGVGVALLIVAGVVVWGVYGFKVEALGSKLGQGIAANASVKERIPIPAKQYFRGLKAVKGEKHAEYLLGKTDVTGKGWWYYFPIAIAVKTPISELLLILGILVMYAVPRLRARLALLPRRELFILLLPVGIYTLAALGLFGVSLNLGIRHILPIYPLLFILVGGWATLRLPARKYYPVLALTSVAQCASVLVAYPNFLAYFNEAVLARGESYHIFVDSNIDWGQDLTQLSLLQHKMNLYPLAFSYFGSTPPEAYGITYTPIAGMGFMDQAPAPDLRRFHGYLAVSVTNLMGGKAFTKTDIFSHLQTMQPLAYAGKTIVIYHLP